MRRTHAGETATEDVRRSQRSTAHEYLAVAVEKVLGKGLSGLPKVRRLDVVVLEPAKSTTAVGEWDKTNRARAWLCSFERFDGLEAESVRGCANRPT